MPVPEQLGSFYLGRTVDEDGAVSSQPLLYDSSDLTTHAVCVGMTGSGKTGLCLSLLEEAALDGVPAIAVDPKGDLGNLLLTFPELRPEDFRPWIDETEATRAGKEPDAFAAEVAERWRQGLASWDQDGGRIARLRATTDLALYTPGSTAGAPLSVLRTLTAPEAGTRDDGDAFRERVISTVSGLLSLLGRDADPVSSTEHILVSRILEEAWLGGEHVDLPTLIRRVQTPPFRQLGVMELDSVISPRDRMALAMALNNLLASPTFAPWMEGPPLNAERLLWTPEGRPRISILSIAHLADAERMFFLTLLLNEVVTWVRRQPGTGSLRALLYIDEVFGMLPPVAEPPSKRPLLTLLKQARAFGVGVVLATQNPVDLDYKALSNAGTWFLGRLQTERDKARVMEGLRSADGAGAGLDAAELDRLLSGLKSRVFVMQNVHERAPVLFHTRWAMSYLRGPLTRSQLRELAAPADRSEAVPEDEVAMEGAGGPAGAGGEGARRGGVEKVHPTLAPAAPPPLLPPEAGESHLSPSGPPRAGSRLAYRSALLGRVRMHFGDRRGLDHWEERDLLAYLADAGGKDPWSTARSFPGDRSPSPGPPPDGVCLGPPADAARPGSWKQWEEALESHAYREERLVRWAVPSLELRSEPGEDRRAFRARAVQALREARDREVAELRDRYARRLQSAEDAVRRAEDRVRQQESQLGQQKMQTAISAGSAILGAFLGGRRGLGRGTTALRGAGRIAREREDVAQAEEGVEVARRRLQELVNDVEGRIAELQAGMDPAALTLEEEEIQPRKSDLEVLDLRFVWVPWAVSDDGRGVPLSGI